MAGLGATFEDVPAAVPTSAMIIAIDGPAAAGKGTLAQRLAAHFGLPISTPACSIAPSRRVMSERGLRPRRCGGGQPRAAALDLDRPRATRPARPRAGELGLAGRRPSRRARRPARVPARFRRASRAAPCSTAATSAPSSAREADVKIYVTATPEVRARRRTAELPPRAAPSATRRSSRNPRPRRARCRPRHGAAAPAADALLLDTTDLDTEGAFRAAVAIVERAAKRSRMP